MMPTVSLNVGKYRYNARTTLVISSKNYRTLVMRINGAAMSSFFLFFVIVQLTIQGMHRKVHL